MKVTTNALRGLDMREGVLERYRQYLPITDATPIFTLGEGSTPLVKSRKIGERIGCDQLYFKLEGCNPTGSFKDRGMVVAVAKAIESGAEQIACASTGNTSASAAAYGSYYGLSTIVFVDVSTFVIIDLNGSDKVSSPPELVSLPSSPSSPSVVILNAVSFITSLPIGKSSPSILY